MKGLFETVTRKNGKGTDKCPLRAKKGERERGDKEGGGRDNGRKKERTKNHRKSREKNQWGGVGILGNTHIINRKKQ